MSGDFTEYWTDGLGTAARQTAMARSSKERLIQVETLWSMLNPGKAAPRDKINEAWRNIIMGTEHTWCYMDPNKQPITNDILKVKFGFFDTARELIDSLLDESAEQIRMEGSKSLAVFSPFWERDGIVYLSPDQSRNFNTVTDEKGKQLASQKLSSGELAFVTGMIPAFGSVIYTLKEKKTKSSGTIATGYTLDNGIIKVVIDPQTGDISNIISSGYVYADNRSEAY
jgi:hypothetical protein